VRRRACQAGKALRQSFAFRVDERRRARAGNGIDCVSDGHGASQGRPDHLRGDRAVVDAAAAMGVAIAFDEPGTFGDLDSELGGKRCRLHD